LVPKLKRGGKRSTGSIQEEGHSRKGTRNGNQEKRFRKKDEMGRKERGQLPLTRKRGTKTRRTNVFLETSKNLNPRDSSKNGERDSGRGNSGIYTYLKND